ncbi:methyltransferase [Candidatus Tenderia electrophaga]|jgi:predicted methyltransferase|uniref:Methyltransferase n=1 Tax=Candidatus Tenderia electrophaga TaxID=1748243 RepID=A0A0S2TD55_9GAMM|nr:methyltransferase [Candidatus Tenderia electrophaga]
MNRRLNVEFSRILIIALSAGALFAMSAAVNAQDTQEKLRAILDAEHRSAAHQARDKYRHPVETLSFFGIEDDMTVVEVFPGRGWYTEILAPFLKDHGRFYAAGNDPDSRSEFARKSTQRFKQKMASHDVFNRVNITVLAPPDKTAIAPAGSADMVLTFRNIHNWMAGGYADQVFSAMYEALKPGGVLGVVEHRGDPSTPQDPEARSGYVNQAYAIKLAEDAGFEFVGSAEINANPKDSKHHPKGVWTLPPSLTLGETDREKYLAIGESDRMTLKFIKPEE